MPTLTRTYGSDWGSTQWVSHYVSVLHTAGIYTDNDLFMNPTAAEKRSNLLEKLKDFLVTGVPNKAVFATSTELGNLYVTVREQVLAKVTPTTIEINSVEGMGYTRKAFEDLAKREGLEIKEGVIADDGNLTSVGLWKWKSAPEIDDSVLLGLVSINHQSESRDHGLLVLLDDWPAGDIMPF